MKKVLLLFAVMLFAGCIDSIPGLSPFSSTPEPTPEPIAPEATITIAPTPRPTIAPAATIDITIPTQRSLLPPYEQSDKKYLELEDFRVIDDRVKAGYFEEYSTAVVKGEGIGHFTTFSYNSSASYLLPPGFKPSNKINVTYLFFENSSKAGEEFDAYLRGLNGKPSMTFLRTAASIPSIYTLVINNVSVEADFEIASFGNRSGTYRQITGINKLKHYLVFSSGGHFVTIEMESPSTSEKKTVELAFHLAKINENKILGVQMDENQKSLTCNLLIEVALRTSCLA